MSEMSREEVIKQVGNWYGGFSDIPSEDAIHQAISDMEKLQKIEELIYDNDCSTIPFNQSCKLVLKGDCYKCRYNEVKKILKGE